MLTVACVKWGTKYKPEHVHALRDMCRDHLPEHWFVCLTDRQDVECDTLPLTSGLAGWWAKLEVFNLPGRVLYLDLDVVLQGPLPLRDGNWIMRDPWAPTFNSSVMLFDGMQHLFAGFDRRLLNDLHGDQDYITLASRNEWQEFADSEVQSFKEQRRRGEPLSAPLLVFHGDPKPWEVNWRVYGRPGEDQDRRALRGVAAPGDRGLAGAQAAGVQG